MNMITLIFAMLMLPRVFNDNMVLQQGQQLPVWGEAGPCEQVTVSFSGQSVSTVADAQGKWRVKLAPLKTSSEGRTFTVTSQGARETVAFTNVVVGEVWFCSGQSNMEFPMGGLPWDATRCIKDRDREIAAANYPLIRHFKVPRKTANEPVAEIKAEWELTTPKTVVNKSAVAYTFGETLHKELKVPVGLIDCSWGGTRIEPWTPAGHPDDLWMLQNLRKWDRAQDVPTVLWNGMVAGLVPYGIKGAIWYQGCANRNDGEAYIDKTVALVRGWRREWGQGDFPYYLVQLAPFKYENPKGESLAIFQMAQTKIPEHVPNSGYTVINDVGNVNDIHPTDKRTVGRRMADQALERTYGHKVREWRCPVATAFQVDGESARIKFKDAEGLATRDGAAPTEFELRTIAEGWIPAEAKIEGTDVVLKPMKRTGEALPMTILGVRFAPYNASTPNLVNGHGLPAGPFKLSRNCPLGAAEELVKAAGYECVQRYDIPAKCDLRVARPQTLASRQNVRRVAYLLELQQLSGDVTWVIAEADAFAAASDELVLTEQPEARAIRETLKNLTVRTNSTELKARTLGEGGFIEFYNSNYSPKTMNTPAGGDGNKYDFNDTPQPNAVKGLGYGCLQIHDLKAKETVFAFNHFNSNSVACDIGIGKNPRENPDWTFARNGESFKARRLSVWVK